MSGSGRLGGYASISDYAAVGDGRTIALIARDGAIDWLCLPDLDSEAVFGALLDKNQGGRFMLAPAIPFQTERRYVLRTNVLETTHQTANGTVRVTDALTLPAGGLVPGRELVRSVQGLSGVVPLRWSVEPAFGFGLRQTHFGRRSGVPIAMSGTDAFAVLAWEAGDPAVTRTAIGSSFEAKAGSRATIALCSAHGEPLVMPPRAEVEDRLERTCEFWRGWADGRSYDGVWREAVLRSALALKLLVHAPSGSVAAAATTSLPEAIGEERNWDYRFCWLRDSSFALAALLQLGCTGEADAFFWWLMHASQLTHPRLQVFYRLGGGVHSAERLLDLEGYRGSRPVRVGNAAATQVQLDIYGDLLQTAWAYAEAGRPLEKDIGRRLASTADLVCRIWEIPDAGLWEMRGQTRHFTHSKMMCWVTLDRAARLAAAGHLPDGNVGMWQQEAGRIKDFIEQNCWSKTMSSYTGSAGNDQLDAALLMAVLFGFSDTDDSRLSSTVDAVRRELASGPLIYRYLNEDGLAGKEGCFLACSFWLVEALARLGRRDEAGELMEQLLSLANDVGLYAEEVDPGNRAFLGNFPQALTHLSLISAAMSLQGNQ